MKQRIIRYAILLIAVALLLPIVGVAEPAAEDIPVAAEGVEPVLEALEGLDLTTEDDASAEAPEYGAPAPDGEDIAAEGIAAPDGDGVVIDEEAAAVGENAEITPDETALPETQDVEAPAPDGEPTAIDEGTAAVGEDAEITPDATALSEAQDAEAPDSEAAVTDEEAAPDGAETAVASSDAAEQAAPSHDAGETILIESEESDKPVTCPYCKGRRWCRFCLGDGCVVCHYKGVCTMCGGLGKMSSAPASAIKRSTKSSTTSSTVKNTVPKKAKTTINVGNTYQIDLKGFAGKRFKSSKKRVATVDANGLVTAKAAGKTKITFKAGKKKCSLTVKVVDPTIPTSIALNATGTVNWYKQDQLALVATLPEGTTSDIRWKSSDKKIATVDNGLVTFKRTGKVTISATTVRGKKRAKVTVKVLDGTKASAIAIVPPETTTLKVGDTLALTADATLARPVDAANPTYDPGARWKSSKKKVASVNKTTGLLTAKKPGTTTVTVTSGSKKKSSIVITVVQ